MRVPPSDREIQDYVDGRMPPDERRGFERRMAEDERIAARVRELRAVGAALRDEQLGLPPEFYSRLRQRFEAGRGRQLGWRRVVSWEAAGLATAAALLVLVFVPHLLERSVDSPYSDRTVEPRPRDGGDEKTETDRVAGGPAADVRGNAPEAASPPPVRSTDELRLDAGERKPVPAREQQGSPAPSRPRALARMEASAT
ncbi:MAG TPA: hypothetical protein VD788_13185, partial [Candidatus Polarisedimenticolaceae bacterium]|nr:hypothetical protein [Candidatus Polarisedimenticolaceae bacterium]